MNILSTHDSIRIITLLGRRKVITDKELMADEKLDDFEYARGKEKEKLASVLQFFLYGVPSVYYGDEEGLEGDLDPYNRRCFDWQNGDKELIIHYQKLAKIRKERAVFKSGEFNLIKAQNGLFIFSRGDGYEKITIALNAGDRTKELVLSANMKELYSDIVSDKFEIKPNGFLILENC